MFIHFRSRPGKTYAIRPFLGGVNAISGQSIIDDLISDMPEEEVDSSRQDYVVVPKQKRLDGVAIRPGVVKQFVAAKLSPPKVDIRSRPDPESEVDPRNSDDRSEAEIFQPLGETIEWQMTGQDAIGGIQLQIIPQFNVDRIYAANMPDIVPVGPFEDLRSYEPVYKIPKRYDDVLSSPEELGLSEGDIIHVKNMEQQKQGSRPKVIRDLLEESPAKLGKGDVIELEVYYGPERIFNVRKNSLTEPAVSFKVEFLDKCSKSYFLIGNSNSSASMTTSTTVDSQYEKTSTFPKECSTYTELSQTSWIVYFP
jgi:hypothetical protein